MPNRPVVILLHGLGKTERSMKPLSTFLSTQDFECWSCNYPSREFGLAELARQITPELIRLAAGRPISAVTHSMGGIIVRHIDNPAIRWNKIVMLAPPNQGSKMASGLTANFAFRWYYGPAGIALGDSTGWPMPPAPFGIIAGTKQLSFNSPASWIANRRFAPGALHDGTVAVDETKLPGMNAFAQVDATHSGIIRNKQVHGLVNKYLREGKF